MKKYTHEYITRKRIRVGIWNFDTVFANQKCMQEMVNLGVDTIFHGDATMNRATRETTLRIADELGVEVYVNDFSIGDGGNGEKWTPEKIANFDFAKMVSTYAHHPSFAGNYIIDKHGTEDFPWVAEITKKYQEQTGRTGYITLLAKDANAAQLKYGANQAEIEYYDNDPELFQKYNDEFCKQYDTFYISSGIYPLNWGKNYRKSTYKDYIEAINQTARAARKYGKEFWCCIQAYGWTFDKRTPTRAEYQWQCYCALSFGCTCITLWNYCGDDKFPSLVHPITTRPTAAYYDIQPVLWEMQNLSDLYIQYKNLGAFTVNCTDATPYLKMTQEYTDFSIISDIKCEDPLLFGCFEKEKGRGKAFTVVNMVDWQTPKDTTVKFKTKAKKVTVYRNAEPTVLTANRGVYTIDLKQGDGVFVTLD